MGKKAKQYSIILLSFVIVSLAQPDWSPIACIICSCCGFALFWKGMLEFSSRLGRFCLATLWFSLITAVHLNWFMADRYVGIYIYPFLLMICCGFGVQFGCISLMIRNPREMGLVQMLGISGGWTILEWTRLYFLSGFSWDPTGLALTGTLAGSQMVTVAGIYGLSFWVFLTNLLALRLLSNISLSYGGVWMTIAATPYLFGCANLAVHSRLMELDPTPVLSALLVQTSLLPEEKVPMQGSQPFTPVMQWERILNFLAPYANNRHDLIVLPEGTVPYGTDFPLYHPETVFHSFNTYFQEINFVPTVFRERVGNRFWAQSLANVMRAEVVIGMEDADLNSVDKISKTYNAAFLFHPFSVVADRYEKRVLVPMGEYIPFNWCKKILSQYGIMDSYTPGDRAKVFQAGRVAAGLSICYEETYGNLMRGNRNGGAEVLVNITNDIWYPESRLAIVHFLHGRLRAIEGGIPLLRACNTGVTCGVDALGRVVGQLPYESSAGRAEAGVLEIDLPLYSYTTLYILYGDSIILCISFFFSTFCLLLFARRRKLIVQMSNFH